MLSDKNALRIGNGGVDIHQESFWSFLFAILPPVHVRYRLVVGCCRLLNQSLRTNHMVIALQKVLLENSRLTTARLLLIPRTIYVPSRLLCSTSSWREDGRMFRLSMIVPFMIGSRTLSRTELLQVRNK